MTSAMKPTPRNPWLDIPLADYEQHMDAPAVAQAAMLADRLHELVDACAPLSLALLGSAGGNGLDRVNPSVTRRMVAVDLNADYLETCRARYGTRFASFEPVHCDLSSGLPFTQPVELVYVGLILEYLNVDAFLEYAPLLVTEGGRISFVFQDPDRQQGAVTSSGVTSVQALKSAHIPVNVTELIDRLLAQGMVVEDRRGVATAPGKSFTLLTVRKRLS